MWKIFKKPKQAYYRFYRRYINAKMNKIYPCEKVFGDRGTVYEMAKIINNNRESLEYSEYISKEVLGKSLFEFLEMCSREAEYYNSLSKKEEDIKSRQQKLDVNKKLRKKAY